jgi:pSer/pThr/pTyr-binding forkhead associated (FHA) protein
MARKTLVIDANRDHFHLEVDSGTLKLGMNSEQTEGVAKYLRITRIRCEVEIEDERDAVPLEEPGVISGRSIRSGMPLQLRHAQISMNAPNHAPATAPSTAPVNETPPPTPISGKSTRRLKVIDGADSGRTFRLPESGTLTVGKNSKQVDIGLDDLYVAKHHCTLELSAEQIVVTHHEGPGGTFIDGQRIHQPQLLRTNSILRVGNSHLKLEVGVYADEPATKSNEPERSGNSSSSFKAVGAPTAPEEVFDPNDPMMAFCGEIIGHYEINRPLGRGYAGAMFLAKDLKTDHLVALKLIDSDFPASNGELERFARELKSIQSLRHEHLVAPLGAGKTATHCWIAREYVEGESAQRLIERVAKGEKPNWTGAVRIGIHLTQALTFLHEKHVLHKNIVPKNVLVRTSDLCTKLADLKFAECLAESELQEAVLEAKVLAELPYTAPEQAEPGGFIDGLADLYAVGAVMYALMTGRPPISGGDRESTIQAIQSGQITRLKAINKRIPNELDGAVMKMLALHQEDRFQTAQAVLTELQLIAKEHGIQV